MLFTQRFRDNKATYEWKARQAKIRVDPYTRADVSKLEDEDLERISDSIKSMETEWDGKEFAYFVSDPVVKTMIDSRKRVVYVSYRDMMLAHRMKVYLDHHEKHIHSKCVPHDYDDYLEEQTLSSWQQALRLDMLDQYFSGVGMFRKLNPEEECGRRVIYKDDYEDFIKSMDDKELFRLFAKYRQPIAARHQSYDNATTFVQTMSEQVEKYILILRDMPEPVYIPGDGIGVGSYVCRMLNKKYVSCEQGAIGYEAYLVGLITYYGKMRMCDAASCASVFLGNVVNFLSEEELLGLKDMKVCIWDEQPKGIKGWFNGGDVRLWYNYEVVPLMPEMKFKFPRILINLSERYNLIPDDNICAAIMEKYKIKSNPGKKLIITSHPVLGKPSYCVFTRSFSYDVKHGRRGQMKDMGVDIIEWRPDPIILDGYFGKVAIKEYELNVITDFEYNGDVIEAKVRYPQRMKYVRMGAESVKVVYVGQNLHNKKYQFRFNSDYSFTKKKEDD